MLAGCGANAPTRLTVPFQQWSLTFIDDSLPVGANQSTFLVSMEPESTCNGLIGNGATQVPQLPEKTCLYAYLSGQTPTVALLLGMNGTTANLLVYEFDPPDGPGILFTGLGTVSRKPDRGHLAVRCRFHSRLRAGARVHIESRPTWCIVQRKRLAAFTSSPSVRVGEDLNLLDSKQSNTCGRAM